MKFTRKSYLELWRDDTYISRHTSLQECAERAYEDAEANGGAVYQVKIAGIYYEIDMSFLPILGAGQGELAPNPPAAALGYPRTAAVIISGWPTGNHTLTDIETFAKANWVTVNLTSSTAGPSRTVPVTGAPGNEMTDQEVVDKLREENPNILVTNFATHIATEANPESDLSAFPYVESIRDELLSLSGPTGVGGPTNWYAHRVPSVWSQPPGKYIPGDWPGQFFLNWSQFVQDDPVTGKKLAGWQANKRYTDNYAYATYDGYMVDVQRTQPNSPADQIDFDQDNDTDESGIVDAALAGATLYKTFEAEFIDEMDTLIGGTNHVVLGNNGNTWIRTRTSSDNPGTGQFVSPAPEYEQKCNGGMWEGALGKGFSDDIFKGWEYVMQACVDYAALIPSVPNLFKDIPFALDGKAHSPLVIVATAGPWDNYQQFRYSICTVLMCDAYFNYQAGDQDGELEWGHWQPFDEYHKGDAEEYNWLGQPIDAMTYPLPTFENGIYAREFDNGAVFINPRGNGTAFCDPTNFKGGQWDFFTGLVTGLKSGTQDINDGSQITAGWNMPEMDGVVVVRRP